jgi:predicted secreted Zn-dependent protease
MRYYTVYGTTAGQINNQIFTCTPVGLLEGRFAASTDYAINWAYSFSSNQTGQCQVTQASVSLATAITLPNWQAGFGNVQLQNQWNAFVSHLTTHENGHIQFAQQYAAQILNDLQNFPPTDCATITQAVDSKAHSELAALDQANEAYDATTNHGATQGAIL